MKLLKLRKCRTFNFLLPVVHIVFELLKVCKVANSTTVQESIRCNNYDEFKAKNINVEKCTQNYVLCQISKLTEAKDFSSYIFYHQAIKKYLQYTVISFETITWERRDVHITFSYVA